MTDLLQRIEALTSAVCLLAQAHGARMSKAELSARLGIHRNTLAKRMAGKDFPKAGPDGKWAFSDIIYWEQHFFHKPGNDPFAEPDEVVDMPIDGPGFHLYRHFDKDGNLLYVGVSLSALSRLSRHRDREWFKEIARVEISNWETREASLRAERRAIRTEHPRHNITHALRRVA
jgi:hypothetical protein